MTSTTFRQVDCLSGPERFSFPEYKAGPTDLLASGDYSICNNDNKCLTLVDDTGLAWQDQDRSDLQQVWTYDNHNFKPFLSVDRFGLGVTATPCGNLSANLADVEGSQVFNPNDDSLYLRECGLYMIPDETKLATPQVDGSSPAITNWSMQRRAEPPIDIKPTGNYVIRSVGEDTKTMWVNESTQTLTWVSATDESKYWHYDEPTGHLSVVNIATPLYLTAGGNLSASSDDATRILLSDDTVYIDMLRQCIQPSDLRIGLCDAITTPAWQVTEAVPAVDPTSINSGNYFLLTSDGSQILEATGDGHVMASLTAEVGYSGKFWTYNADDGTLKFAGLDSKTMAWTIGCYASGRLTIVDSSTADPKDTNRFILGTEGEFWDRECKTCYIIEGQQEAAPSIRQAYAGESGTRFAFRSADQGADGLADWQWALIAVAIVVVLGTAIGLGVHYSKKKNKGRR